MTTGPLDAITVVEFAGLGPAPFAAMLLADLGADVIRVDRPGVAEPSNDALGRGKRSVVLDLKDDDDLALARRLVERCDVLVEGYRPGVMERLGLGPADCHASNPALVYARMTGWGQTGPLSTSAGHDLDFVAVTGALWAMGDADRPPPPPLNLVGDFGGGATFLVIGVLAALLTAQRTGRGDVVDAAVVDGTALLTTLVHGMRQRGMWRDERAANLLDSGAPFYRTYRCADDRFVAVAAIEPAFYSALVAATGFPGDPAEQYDVAGWPHLADRWARHLVTRPRDAWVELAAGVDACLAPVLTWDEATRHAQLRDRGVFLDIDGSLQPAPAPRLSSHRPQPGRAPRHGEHTEQVRRWLGLP